MVHAAMSEVALCVWKTHSNGAAPGLNVSFACTSSARRASRSHLRRNRAASRSGFRAKNANHATACRAHTQ